MKVNIDTVVENMSVHIASLTKDNIILRVLVQQLENELNSIHASQVKEEGSGI